MTDTDAGRNRDRFRRSHHSPPQVTVAVVGATGLVGETLLRILEERKFPAGQVRAFATARSAGKTVRAFGKPVTVEQISADADPTSARALFGAIDFAFFAVGEPISRRLAPISAEAGALVVDKSSAFRLDPAVPLVVPEVNLAAAAGHRLIANPNCSTIPLAVALWPIERAFGLEWVSVATYQSVSGAGKEAVNELEAQTRGEAQVVAFPRRIAANVLPEIGPFDAEGHGEEERKIAAELQKIIGRPDLRISATSVRVPVVVGHAEAVSFKTRKKATRQQLADVLAAAEGVRFFDGTDYASPLDIAGTDDVAVGRLRSDQAHDGAYLCWIVCDNLRKGAATNAVQIAEAALRLTANVPA